MNAPETKYYIGIDGGGTKTKFLAGRVTESLEVIGEYTGGGCHYMQIGFDGLERLIREGVTAVCENAGIRPGDVAFAFAGCAGFGDVESDQPMVDRAMAAGFGDMPFAAENDSANALEGALCGAGWLPQAANRPSTRASAKSIAMCFFMYRSSSV